jgi:hypothetical protein
MTPPIKDRVADIYWYDIIKDILSENNMSLFSVEIWEKLRDNYGYPYNKDRVVKELINIQRTGYAKSIFKNGKQAWIFPSGAELLTLEQNKKIDNTIINLVDTLGRPPTLKEISNKIRNELPENQRVPERLLKISTLIKLIDKIIEKEYTQNKKELKEANDLVQRPVPQYDINVNAISFYEFIIDKLDGKIGDIDMLTLIHLINTRKKKFQIFS